MAQPRATRDDYPVGFPDHDNSSSQGFRFVTKGKNVSAQATGDNYSIGCPDQHYTKVYVQNFGKDFQSDQLATTFEKFGKIVSAKVMTDETGKCRGFGFVNFETHDAAAKAVEAMLGGLVNGRQVYCGPAHKKERQKKLVSSCTHGTAAKHTSSTGSARQGTLRAVADFPRKETNQDQGVDQHYTKVYVKNFGKDFQSDQLATTFEKFGKIVSAEVMTDETGKCRGFGFVNFETHDAAAKAVEAMLGGLVNGRQVYCGPAHKKERQKELVSSCTHGTAAKHTSSTGSARQGTLRAVADFPRKETNQDQGVDQHYTKVYVKNFGNDFSFGKLATTFEKFGTVLSLELLKTDEAEKCCGLGFVDFDTHDAAAKAVEAMEGALVNGRQAHCGPVHKEREQQKELVRAAQKKERQKALWPRLS